MDVGASGKTPPHPLPHLIEALSPPFPPDMAQSPVMELAGLPVKPAWGREGLPLLRGEERGLSWPGAAGLGAREAQV